MNDPTQQPSGCQIVARGWAGGAIGGGPIGWAILCALVSRELTPVAVLEAAIAGGLVGAFIGSLVGLLSGIVLAVREDRPRSDHDQRVTAAVASAAPFVLVTVLVWPASPGGWLAGLAIAAVSAAAGAALAPCVVHGWARATWS